MQKIDSHNFITTGYIKWYSLSRIVFRRRRRLCVSEVQYLFYNKILTLVYDAASISYARVN